MERQELHNKMVEFVKKLYDENTNPDYDIEPMVSMSLDGKTWMVMVHAVGMSPMDAVSKLLEQKQPEAMCFACPIWRKDPETMERTGEGLMVISETRKERYGQIFVVERDPLPVLTEQEVDGADYTPRLKLLFEPSTLQ